MKNKRKKSIIWVLFCCFFICSVYSKPVYASTTRNDESLVSNISNPTNGRIKFTIKVPAKTTIQYKVELVPSKRMGAIDSIDGKVSNKKTKAIWVVITVKVKFFSNKYTVSASYMTGPSRNRTIHKDTDSFTSDIKTTVYSSKFVWNDKNIKRYNACGKLSIALSFAGTVTIDILIAKGYATSTWATVYSVGNFVYSIVSQSDVASIDAVVTTPIKDWGYRTRLTPMTGGGYKIDLLIYNEAGKLYKVKKIGQGSTNVIALIPQ